MKHKILPSPYPSLQREGYKNATAYIPVKGHYGRSYTADRW